MNRPCVFRTRAAGAENGWDGRATYEDSIGVEVEGAWDIFRMTKLTYLARCNRVSGPGAEGEE